MSENFYCEECHFGPCTVAVTNPGHHIPECCVMGHGLDPDWVQTEAITGSKLTLEAKQTIAQLSEGSGLLLQALELLKDAAPIINSLTSTLDGGTLLAEASGYLEAIDDVLASAKETGDWVCESCGSTDWQVSSINDPLREVVMCSDCGWHKEESGD